MSRSGNAEGRKGNKETANAGMQTSRATLGAAGAHVARPWASSGAPGRVRSPSRPSVQISQIRGLGRQGQRTVNPTVWKLCGHRSLTPCLLAISQQRTSLRLRVCGKAQLLIRVYGHRLVVTEIFFYLCSELAESHHGFLFIVVYELSCVPCKWLC